jgi:hypothetical protein
MIRHYVGRWDDPSQFVTPKPYEGHVGGYKRFELVDHTIIECSVHMGLALVDIEPGGYLNPVLHAFEKGFYVLPTRYSCAPSAGATVSRSLPRRRTKSL